MNFIISKLNVATLKTTIIYSSEVEEQCKAKLLDLIQNNTNINKVVENDYIRSYLLETGYIYDRKKLQYIYQILKVTKESDENKGYSGY